MMTTIFKISNILRLVSSTLLFILFPFYKLNQYISYLTKNKASVKLSNEIDPNKNYILIANHRSWYDFFYLRDFLFKYVNNKPCTGMYKAGIGYEIYAFALKLRKDIYFCNLDKNALRKNIEYIQNGFHCMLFPEGTRNRTTAPLLPFKRGIDKIISTTDADVLLINMKFTRNILKGLNTTPTIDVIHINKEELKQNNIEDLYRAQFNC